MATDHQIAQLQRLIQADPQNVELIEQLYLVRRRIEGSGVLLECLASLDSWSKTSESLQDCVLKEVSLRHPGFEFIEARVFQCLEQSFRIGVFRHRKTDECLHLIPGGTYTMGSDRVIAAEKPAHECTVKPFFAARYPLRQKIWDMGELEDDRQWVGESLPIDHVNWHDVKKWCEWAGDGLRLPSEAEWEFACRASVGTSYYWGDSMNPDYAWYDDNSDKRTHPVTDHDSQFNAFGLVDMCGNIWEWCEDGYHPNYDTGPSDHRPRESEAQEKALRGSAWMHPPGGVRSAMRIGISQNSRTSIFGARIFCSLNWDDHV
ncbi:MAG: formylglycine-generating enzyme family protein [Planctomycetota bacterium]|nr:formylglycine-generating enzyme family protein [Planctomycetota bacterium]